MTASGEPADRGSWRGDLARAALGIAAVTALARLLGFGRLVVFGQSVGTETCLASVYYTANTLPNLVFEVVAGGALASMVVPLLAGSVASGDTERASRTASGLLTWTLLLLVPVSILAAVLAGPAMRLLTGDLPGCDAADSVALGARMLVVFAPQIALYGVAVVLTGMLQAHRRFLGPALAPLLSSLVVMAAYLAYGAQAGSAPEDLSAVPRASELTLSVGTTLGVVALSMSLLIPLRRTGLRLRPTLHFPDDQAVRARRLALAGMAALVAQQASLAIVLWLANTHGGPGGVYFYTVAWTLFLVPWSVLAVPVATSAFPALSASWESGSRERYAELSASATRAVLLIAAGAAASLIAASVPAARMLLVGTKGNPDPLELARAIVTFAPGLIGYALVAHLGRALYAAGAGRAAAGATVAGWLAVIAADLVLVPAATEGWEVAALGAGNTIGMTLAGMLLLLASGRLTAGAALTRVPRTAATALNAGTAVAAAGWLASRPLSSAGPIGSALATAGIGAAALLAFAALASLTARSELRAALRRGSAHA
ncbi:MAG: virulence factor MviN [Actinomycetota bacterium]|nr:virulence factor MviN [Actinomycetota bacterium]